MLILIGIVLPHCADALSPQRSNLRGTALERPTARQFALFQDSNAASADVSLTSIFMCIGFSAVVSVVLSFAVVQCYLKDYLKKDEEVVASVDSSVVVDPVPPPVPPPAPPPAPPPEEVAQLKQEVAQVKQEVAQLHEAWARGEKNVQQEYAGMKLDLDKMYMMIKKDGEDFVKRKEFVAATQLINQEHLKKIIENVVNSAKQHVSEFPPTRPECPPSRSEEPRQEATQQKPIDPPGRYRVVHSDLVYVREDSSSDSPVLGYKSHGDVVTAVSAVDNWLKLSENGWLLRDGQTLGLGVLLERDGE
jgi:hypothetical protein